MIVGGIALVAWVLSSPGKNFPRLFAFIGTVTGGIWDGLQSI
jgi:hypothetical protein